MNKGFTLVELLVVVAIIAILSGVILFTVTQYIAKSKDSNVFGSLSVLTPAGEIFYNGNGNSYEGFCASDFVQNQIGQMPAKQGSASSCTGDAKVCCKEDSDTHQTWAACTQEFEDLTKAYCVDSRGKKENIDDSLCTDTLTVCP